jgi:dolichol-phosphate mannosyltransferase
MASSCGLKHSKGEAVIIMDDDLQDPPEILPMLIHKWKEGYDVVYAIRNRQEKKLLYTLFYKLFNKISYQKIPLDSGDFGLMSRRVVDVINSMPEHSRLLRGMRAWVGFKQTSIVYDRPPRERGKTGYNLLKIGQFVMYSLLAFSNMPLYISFAFGVIALSCGKFFDAMELFCIGILGKYIVRITDEVNQFNQGENKYMIAVIGGGIGGLVTGYLLAQRGHKVKLFEKTNQLGGLARTTPINGKPIEVYYHHYDSTHKEILKLCKELDIKVTTFQAKRGYLSGGRIYDFDNGFDLLNFTPLPFLDRLKLGLAYFFQVDAGEKVYEVVWKPLLIQKFGEHYENIKMNWIWSRPKTNGKLLYFSTQELIDKLRDKILENGEILTEQTTNKDAYEIVIDTTQTKDMLPVTCLMLVLDRPLTKYYWLNIGDLNFPFGLIVEKDNIVWITKYGKAEKDFIRHLVFINPDFEESWIKEAHIFHDDFAQEINPIVEDRGLNNVIIKAKKTISCI